MREECGDHIQDIRFQSIPKVLIELGIEPIRPRGLIWINGENSLANLQFQRDIGEGSGFSKSKTTIKIIREIERVGIGGNCPTREPSLEEGEAMSFKVWLISKNFAMFSVKSMNDILSMEDLGRQMEETGVRVPLVEPGNTGSLEPELINVMEFYCVKRLKISFQSTEKLGGRIGRRPQNALDPSLETIKFPENVSKGDPIPVRKGIGHMSYFVHERDGNLWPRGSCPRFKRRLGMPHVFKLKVACVRISSSSLRQE